MLPTRFVCVLLVLGLAGSAASGYTLAGPRWRTSPVRMQLQLGSPPAPLLDGGTSWDAVAESALTAWNTAMGNLQFAAVPGSTASRAERNQLNNVFFSADVYGEAWGTGVLAVTLSYTVGGTVTESDVVFNNRLNWNSYRGALRTSGGASLHDFRRVAMHEFGHVLGLDHPDQAGQSLTALMNSRVSALDTLAPDDIAGVQALYGAPAVVVVTTPVITAAPASQSVAAGGTATFTVAVTGLPPFSYQWFKDGVALAGAIAPTLTLPAAEPATSGAYSVRVTNASGSATSGIATLTVTFSRLINLSTRGFVPAGGALTPGFHLRGSASKPLLIRGVGPTLAAFGVSAALADTRLEVIPQGSRDAVAANNDWGGTPALSEAFTRLGAFPLAAGSKDAALETSLSPRGYSVRITASDNTMSGVTLAEIYDTAPLATASPQLVNLSTLGYVGTGDNVLTAGFIINGNTSKRLLIRAVGPGLAPFGVGDLLADPQIGVVPPGSSEPIATNDDWPDNATLRAAFAAAGAFPLPSGSRDSALIATLAPGAYTVIVSGVNATLTGQALVEIYDLDP